MPQDTAGRRDTLAVEHQQVVLGQPASGRALAQVPSRTERVEDSASFEHDVSQHRAIDAVAPAEPPCCRTAASANPSLQVNGEGETPLQD